METRLKCSSYLFAFSLRLLIRLNINCGFEYKKGYLSFRVKGLSCGFSIAYFDKISGEMFCEKIKLYHQIVHIIEGHQIVIALKFPLQSCIYF
jgi:hypothetical protein